MFLKKISLLLIILFASEVLIFAGDSFNYSENLILSTTGISIQNDIMSLPVLIKLDKSFDFTRVKDNGADVRFTTSDGTNLPYTIDKWDDKDAQVWVLVPLVKANNSEQFITFYFGNDAASSQDDESSVFKDVEHDMIGIYDDSGFKIVNKTKDEATKKDIKERRMK